MSERPDPITKKSNASAPGIPRSIRARTGDTAKDPVPDGFTESSSPTRHFPIEPAGHDVERAKPRTEDMGISETQLAVKNNLEGDEVAQELAHRNMTEEVRQQDLRRQQQAMVQNDVRGKQGPPNKALWQGTSSAANKQMDSRSGQRPFTM